MPKMQLSSTEAAALKRKRARDKSWNATVMTCIETIKRRQKGSDALQAATLNAIVGDLRKLIR